MTKLTQNEIALLKGIDCSEYGEYLQDATWTFSASDYSGLKPRSVPPVIASLLKKGLVTRGGDGTQGNEYTLCMTDAGIEAYISAVGIINVKKAPHQATREEFINKQNAAKALRQLGR